MKRYSCSIPKTLRASFTIEAAVIVPVILGVFAMIVTLLFYYHDKNVVGAIAHETAVMGCGQEEITAAELEQYFQKRLGNKLLLFSPAIPEAQVEQERIVIICHARKRRMKMQVQISMNRTEPEEFIRNMRRLGKIGEQIGEKK